MRCGIGRAGAHPLANGNKSQAARLLGLSRNAFPYRLSKLGVPDEPET
jgi:DNA-binding NtrC family response regulator